MCVVVSDRKISERRHYMMMEQFDDQNFVAQLDRKLLKATRGFGYDQVRGVLHDVYYRQFCMTFVVVFPDVFSEPTA